ncbi:MAG: hypothetical protein QXT35_06740 [Conexivisphaerales archaeon]
MRSRESQHLIHDGTGYSLTINYRMLRRIWQRSIRKKQLFAYMFAIIDLKDVHLVQVRK